MTRERLYLFDTTLRDGAQTQGVDFGVEDKRLIAEALDRLGVDYVEGGWPGANPTDTAFFGDPPKFKHARLAAFGMTKRVGRSAENDPGLAALFDGQSDAVVLVGKTWDFHAVEMLGLSLDENLDLIRDSVEAVIKHKREAMFDAEHFFDGYKSNPDFALASIKAAYDGGARWVVLCDTNGGALPEEIEAIVTEVLKVVPGDHLGIHAHNDMDLAAANSLAAVRAGARQIQGSLNGLGERCGNANLASIIPTLHLKDGYRDKYETGITDASLGHLTQVSRLLDELLARAPDRNAPYVGTAAFAHKGGLHVSAVEKNPQSYEHIAPELVGNVRHILVSDQSGRSNILARLREIGLDVDPKDAKVGRLLEDVKEREFQGLSYDGAEASFELLARRALGGVPEYFRVESFRTLVERRHNARGELVTTSEATTKLNVDGALILSVGEGNGPVNALDNALRKDVGKYTDYLTDIELVDFKVRILTQEGTGAVTRVMIECMDGAGARWSTVGVSPNIVDAAFEALFDSFTYKLFRDGAPPGAF
ncbi:MAG TPA: citramalate synthase [Sulfitobacter sp.]|nr:citramalate synthase [Sulfitobacter sp.]